MTEKDEIFKLNSALTAVNTTLGLQGVELSIINGRRLDALEQKIDLILKKIEEANHEIFDRNKKRD